MGILLASVFVTSIFAQDPVKTDGDKYKTILENETVRVLKYSDKPGEKTNQHHHPDFVLYAIAPFKRRLTFGNGQVVEREFKKGDVIWMKDQIHVGENIGTTETHALIVEIKKKKLSRIDCGDSATAPALEKAWKKNTPVDSSK
jgi:quercetin dioxygenase-like cupin family protein